VKITRYQSLVFEEVEIKKACYGYLKEGGVTWIIVQGRRQANRLKEVLAVMEKRNIDFAKLDERFFVLLSLYLCEERDLNFELLLSEIRRLS
jgi:hypothetical protein